MSYRVLSFNILSGINEPRYPLVDRIDKIIQYIKSVSADIICLQEVAKTVIASLETSFVTDGYFVSRTYTGREFVMILTKFPHTSTTLVIDSNKAFVIAEYNDIQIVGIHLTSDCAKDSIAKRQMQLQLILNVIKADRAIIVGDVNMSGKIEELVDYTDCAIASTSVEPTFNTDSNEIAKICKKDEAGVLARFDRIYLKGFICMSYEVDTKIVLSDHYPILAQIL